MAVMKEKIKNEEYTRANIFVTYLLISFTLLILYPFWLYFQNKSKFIFPIIVLLFLISNFLLIILLGKYKSNGIPNKTEEKDNKTSKNYSLVKDKLFLSIISIATIIHIPLLFFPLTNYSDELSHISCGMYLAQAIKSFIGSFSFIIPTLFGVLIFSMYKFKEKIFRFIKNRYAVFSAIIILFSFFYYVVINKIFLSYASGFVQKSLAEKLPFLLNGMKALLVSFFIIIFGYQEFAVRIPYLLAYIFTAVVLYKICIEFLKSKKTAVYSILILLFFQGFFYFGSIAYDAAIVTLVLTSSLYLFLKYKETEDQKFLFYLFTIITLGIVYDKKIIIIFVIFLFFGLIDLIKQKDKKEVFLRYFTPIIISITVFLWYFVLDSLHWLNIVGLKHTESLIKLRNVFSQNILINLEIIHYIISILGTILLLISLIYFFATIKKNKINKYLLILFILFYLFFTLQKFIGLPRYMVPLSIVFSLIITQFLVYIEKKNKAFKLVSIIFIVFLISTTTFSAYYYYKNRYLPSNQLFSYIKTNLPEEKFMKSMGPTPYNFYIVKYGLNMNNFDPTIWQTAENQTPENLYDYMKEKNISYVFFPLPTPAYDYYFYKEMPSTWVDMVPIETLRIEEVINHSLILSLYEDKNPAMFKKIAEFNYGRNVLFIAKRNF